MKLSRKELEILSVAQLQAEAPATLLRKYCRYQEHSIRYCLQRALERQLIVPRCFINLNRLGYSQYQLYFSLAAEKKQPRHELVQALAACDRVSWLGQLGGDYQYGMNIAARGVREIADLLYTLSSKCGGVLMDKVVAARLSFKYFGNRYLSNIKRPLKFLSYEATSDSVSLDDLDHRILNAVTRSGQGSSRFLARQLGEPQRTVDFRLKRLEKQGVIVAYYYELQSACLGMQSFLLLLCMKSINSAIAAALDKYCEKNSRVVLLIQSLGSWDFEIQVEVENAFEAAKIVEDLHDQFGSAINWIRVLPAFGNIKVLEYPFQKP